MALFYTDFSQNTTGQLPSGWTERWVTGNNTWSVGTETRSFGGKVLNTTQTVNDDRVISFDAAGTASTVDVAVKFKTTGTTGYQNHVHVRGAGTGSTKTSYYIALYELDGLKYLAVEKWNNGTWTNLQSFDFVWSSNVYYWMRIRVDGRNIQAKVWDDRTLEPTSWTASITEPNNQSNQTAGWIGIGSYANNGTRTFDAVSIATAGETAPTLPPFTEKPFTVDVARDITDADIEWMPTNNFENRTGGLAGVTDITAHWWDDPAVNPSLKAVVDWFKNPASEVSGHFVVSGTRIVQMVDIDKRAWHVLGNNDYTIGIEHDPNFPSGTYETSAGLIRYLRQQTGASLVIHGHNYYPGNESTACPGTTDLNKLEALSYVDPAQAPIADFVASVTEGDAPLTVNFTDTSTESPTSWLWDFGDSTTSTSQNPTKVYSLAGVYTVSLTATNSTGSDSITKTNLITVNVANTGNNNSGVAKVWTGSAWEQKAVKAWNGSTWEEYNHKRWDGSTWI